MHKKSGPDVRGREAREGTLSTENDEAGDDDTKDDRTAHERK